MLGVNTSLPGIVTEYDKETGYATIQPAIMLLDDANGFVSRSPLFNVPVIWPSGGGFSFIGTLNPGDCVQLIFSQRGIDQFKSTLVESQPDFNGFFSSRDAVAIPGYLPLSGATPAEEEDSMSMQSLDGETAVSITSEGHVSFRGEEITWNDGPLPGGVKGVTVTAPMNLWTDLKTDLADDKFIIVYRERFSAYSLRYIGEFGGIATNTAQADSALRRDGSTLEVYSSLNDNMFHVVY